MCYLKLLEKNHEAVYNYCRSLVYHAYTLGFLYLDFHLPNFVLKKLKGSQKVQCYLLDFGSTRRLTEKEQLNTKSQSKEEALQFILQECRNKSPHLFTDSEKGKGYQWFWNDQSSTKPFDPNVDGNLSVVSWDFLIDPMPLSRCVYHKTTTQVCCTLSFVKEGGTKKKIKKKRKSTFYKERKQRAVSVALSPYRLF